MRMKHKSFVLAASLISAGFITSGCGPQIDVAELRSMIDEANRTANLADYKASQAKDMADEALSKVNMMSPKKKMHRKMMK